MTTATAPNIGRRGRPPRSDRALQDTRETLLRAGIELLTCQGFTATGIEAVLSRVQIPKGSFYHYFDSKQAFGLAVLDAYDAYFLRKLDRHLLEAGVPALQRLQHFIDDAQAGMQRFDFQRGCLVGNLGQEVTSLPPDYRQRLDAILDGWQLRVADCLRLAQAEGDLAAHADTEALAAFFWIGWEGAVLRARLARSLTPLQVFAGGFFAGLPR
ncbi:TPA: TetR/AcrR family transcriptional regulator [Pseudomonas aeruginosa]|uniref:acrylate utilization transcriptional regulator AcuR n=1 Tax=Pseudomonadota TaxID=1224 RepID=UPI0004D736C3|nr:MULTISPECIES: TetR/AcrR family transcriptional regulator [Pseudomonadota]HCF7075556.1 TetR/AcrR family transcriptional regulator [Pseudomonas aeruginosa]KEX94179.1 TetR family transcriptional regulator [Pseudomonas putida]MCA7881930.1 TetR/AcrR family transcriptional regulator [Burkholderia contaminans]MDD2014477.1 TetR/AcrR family transcriptional regulator [Pseudomonas putida]MDN7438325.1 TetR/AcrR family transcriptional regulator [Burkholderia cepacia]